MTSFATRQLGIVRVNCQPPGPLTFIVSLNDDDDNQNGIPDLQETLPLKDKNGSLIDEDNLLRFEFDDGGDPNIKFVVIGTPTDVQTNQPSDKVRAYEADGITPFTSFNRPLPLPSPSPVIMYLEGVKVSNKINDIAFEYAFLSSPTIPPPAVCQGVIHGTALSIAANFETPALSVVNTLGSVMPTGSIAHCSVQIEPLNAIKPVTNGGLGMAFLWSYDGVGTFSSLESAKCLFAGITATPQLQFGSDEVKVQLTSPVVQPGQAIEAHLPVTLIAAKPTILKQGPFSIPLAPLYVAIASIKPMNPELAELWLGVCEIAKCVAEEIYLNESVPILAKELENKLNLSTEEAKFLKESLVKDIPDSQDTNDLVRRLEEIVKSPLTPDPVGALYKELRKKDPHNTNKDRDLLPDEDYLIVVSLERSEKLPSSKEDKGGYPLYCDNPADRTNGDEPRGKELTIHNFQVENTLKAKEAIKSGWVDKTWADIVKLEKDVPREYSIRVAPGIITNLYHWSMTISDEWDSDIFKKAQEAVSDTIEKNKKEWAGKAADAIGKLVNQTPAAPLSPLVSPLVEPITKQLLDKLLDFILWLISKGSGFDSYTIVHVTVRDYDKSPPYSIVTLHRNFEDEPVYLQHISNVNGIEKVDTFYDHGEQRTSRWWFGESVSATDPKIDRMKWIEFVRGRFRKAKENPPLCWRKGAPVSNASSKEGFGVLVAHIKPVDPPSLFSGDQARYGVALRADIRIKTEAEIKEIFGT